MEKDLIIELKNVYKDYLLGDGKTVYNVLKNINLKIYSGDFLAIMGPSGSGKSTLMNIVGCLDKITKGIYNLNNINISLLQEDDLAKIRNINIGFVFQNFNLLQTKTILKNVSMPLFYKGDISTKICDSIAMEVLSKVKLDKFANHYPNQLSGGMQQRVAIARALVNNPNILIADEPTGNLDSNTSKEIMNIFKQLNEKYNITVVMVTHEPFVAKYAKRLVVIKDGIKEYDIDTEEAIELNIL